MAASVAYDPFSKAVLADPFPFYAALRERSPVHYFAGFDPPFYTLARSDDVRAALLDSETFSIRYGQSPQYTRGAGLVSDPPTHTAFRQLFNRAFTPRVVARLEGSMEQLAARLFRDLPSGGPVEFRAAFGSPFPTTVIAELLGVPSSDHLRFREMSDSLTATYNESDPAVSGPPRAAFDRYFQVIIDAHRARLRDAGVAEPSFDHVGTLLPDDLISRLVVGEALGRRLEDRELQWLLLLLLLGGNETTTALLTNLLWRLLERPERWEALRAEPHLIEAAVEESLRQDPPVLGLFRTTTRDLELHGVHIPEKAKVMLLFGAVGRDPAVFEEPDAFRLDRDPEDVRRRILTFGFGAHYCPGAALARLEASVSLRLLLERAPNLHLAGPSERIVPFNLWGRSSLPVAW